MNSSQYEGPVDVGISQLFGLIIAKYYGLIIVIVLVVVPFLIAQLKPYPDINWGVTGVLVALWILVLIALRTQERYDSKTVGTPRMTRSDRLCYFLAGLIELEVQFWPVVFMIIVVNLVLCDLHVYDWRFMVAVFLVLAAPIILFITFVVWKGIVDSMEPAAEQSQIGGKP